MEKTRCRRLPSRKPAASGPPARTKRRRFSQTQAAAIKLAHVAEEGRPIETLWDATVGITAYAKGLKHQDARVAIEREGGHVINLAK